MRKYLFAALIALCIAVPGTVTATPVLSCEIAASPEMAPQLVEAILQAAAEQTAWTFEQLNQMYRDGELAIEKVEHGYRVLNSAGNDVIVVIMGTMI